jgi:hypothetical protein
MCFTVGSPASLFVGHPGSLIFGLVMTITLKYIHNRGTPASTRTLAAAVLHLARRGCRSSSRWPRVPSSAAAPTPSLRCLCPASPARPQRRPAWQGAAPAPPSEEPGPCSLRSRPHSPCRAGPCHQRPPVT